MKFLSAAKSALFASALLLAAVFAASPASGQSLPALKANQTFGYSEDQLVTFTYLQSFDCVDQPFDDLNHNGKMAQSDPAEFQIPICQVGIAPSMDPSGIKGATDPTEPLFVLVPMFSADNDQNPNDAISCQGVVSGTICGPTLGKTLIELFGAVPEAFKAKPKVYTQCPDPTKAPGTCTMHASRLDLGPVLVKLGFLQPPIANVFVPTPNHSHIVFNFDANLNPVWWQVIPVLVLDQSDWPSADGTQGITSVAKMRDAESAGHAVQAPSNFYLFFGSQMTHQH